MSYPKKQWLLAVRKGRSVRYFYGAKLGDLITDRVKVGDDFYAAPLVRGEWVGGVRSSEKSYATMKTPRQRVA